jgi:TetR/AcrR family transcriptional regulator
MPVRNRPGRPAGQDTGDAAANIVGSACLQFARHGIRGSSKRLIAAEARVTPALVHYYFKDDAELHLAVLNHAFAPLLLALQQLPAAATLQHWVSVFHAHLAARPWLPHLMIREVLPPNGGLRTLFLKKFAPHIFGSVKAMVTRETQRRKVRPDFDLDRHVVLLLGMLVYPFLGMELAQDVTGRKFDQRMLEGFRDDALRLFRKGLAA